MAADPSVLQNAIGGKPGFSRARARSASVASGQCSSQFRDASEDSEETEGLPRRGIVGFLRGLRALRGRSTPSLRSRSSLRSPPLSEALSFLCMPAPNATYANLAHEFHPTLHCLDRQTSSADSAPHCRYRLKKGLTVNGSQAPPRTFAYKEALDPSRAVQPLLLVSPGQCQSI
jgi:hypothetical protein